MLQNDPCFLNLTRIKEVPQSFFEAVFHLSPLHLNSVASFTNQIHLYRSWKTGLKSVVSQNHRTIGLFGLKGPSKGHLLQPPCSEQGHLQQTRLLRVSSNLPLNISRDGYPSPLWTTCSSVSLPSP